MRVMIDVWKVLQSRVMFCFLFLTFLFFYSMKNLIGPILAILQVVHHAQAHGRLMDPPARNSMWRFGFPNPVNYNDNELYCGGYTGKLMMSLILFLSNFTLYSTVGTK